MDDTVIAKVDYRRLSSQQRQENIDVFLRTLQECGINPMGQGLFSDLLMESEITMVARRIQIARLLLRGESFEQIRKKLQVGLDNITSVDRWLSAKLPAYRALLCLRLRRRRTSAPPEPYKKSPLINLLLGDWDMGGHN